MDPLLRGRCGAPAAGGAAPPAASMPLDSPPVVDSTTTVALDTPYDVVVWDDPITLMTVVTRVLMKVFGFPKEKAHHLMLTVHNEGRATVWTGELSKAEQYCIKLHAHGLLATVEPSR